MAHNDNLLAKLQEAKTAPSSLMEQFLEDAEVVSVNDTELENISKLAIKQKKLEAEVADLSNKLSAKSEELRQVSEIQLPEAMAVINMTSFAMSDGSKITIRKDVTASIRADYIGQAVEWLNDHELGGVVKDEVKVQFGKGDAEKAKALFEYCQSLRYPVTEKMSVHPQTLKALVKEQMAKGLDFPEEYFSIHPLNKAKITAPK